MRLHLVALPHTRVEPESCGCAYTSKVLKFCKMMGDRHEIFLYSPEGPPVPGAAHMVPCLSELDRVEIFGADDPARLPAWPTDKQALVFNLNAAAKILANAQERDLVLLTGGWTHSPIAKVLPDLLSIEPGVGYEGIFTNYCAFESYAWMHSVYAKKNITDIRWFDRVIPPYCDVDDFKLGTKSGYLLFLGRIIERKGPHIAAEIAKAAGLPLIVAGAGDPASLKWTGEVAFVGPVNAAKRAELLAGASALICPTTYAEPGGNVAIEAMLSGTPVITADFGVFSETVTHGVTGFHFRMFREAVMAVKKAADLDPAWIQRHAAVRYSLQAVGAQYDQWFDSLQTLFGKGWYQD